MLILENVVCGPVELIASQKALSVTQPTHSDYNSNTYKSYCVHIVIWNIISIRKYWLLE